MTSAPLAARQSHTLYRLPGEFEKQRAILLSSHELVRDMPELFADIVRTTQGHVSLVVLVTDIQEHRDARETLASRRIPAAHVRYAEAPHDTMWSRDYGPLVVQRFDGRPALVDADYDAQRTNDDHVPGAVAKLLKTPCIRAPLRVDGGNLLSNGQGLCVTTLELLNLNADRYDEPAIQQLLRQYYGADETVILEPLVGEPTGHADMFVTFPSPQVAVVGSYDPQDDPENAAVLDRNAARLAEARTPRGLLKVMRVPMPPHNDGVWRTFVNVMYANGALLMPVYPGVDPIGEERAKAIFAHLLPGWKIMPIDANQVVGLGGALHCVSMNLGPLEQLPVFPKPQRMGGVELVVEPGFAEMAGVKRAFAPDSGPLFPPLRRSEARPALAPLRW